MEELAEVGGFYGLGCSAGDVVVGRRVRVFSSPGFECKRRWEERVPSVMESVIAIKKRL